MRYATYEEFVAALEKRPPGMSPLRWVGLTVSQPEAAEWLLRWVRGKRP